MVRRRRRCLPAAALDDDDIMSEILLRLPPLPSSLPRASLVCKRWRRLVADPHFLRRFREHHRKPPILGFFSKRLEVEFTSALDSPDSIPASRFSLRLDDPMRCKLVDCRHGRVLFISPEGLYFVVWAPVTGERHRVDFPLSFRGKDRKWVNSGAVVCAASEQGHVHGGCHSSPFQVVLLGRREGVFACVYSSETCTWGNAVSVLWPQNISGISLDCANTLVGNSIFWFLHGRSFGILKFDFCTQSLAAIELPSGAVDSGAWCRNECQFLITPADGGGLSFLYLLGFNAQVWKWKATCNGGAEWMLGRNIDLNNLLSLKAGVNTEAPEIMGMAEDDNTMFLSTNVGDFVLHLESMQFKKMSIIMSGSYCIKYPFRSFYSAGHITAGARHLSTVNATGSAKRTTSGVIRAQRVASGIGRNSKNQILKRAGPSMLKDHRSVFGAHSAELDTEHIRSNNEGDDCENLILHMFGSHVPTSVEGAQGAHSERSRSKRPAEYGNSSSSTMPPTLGAEKTESTAVKKQQHEPTQEFSVSNCINALRQMVDLSDEEKVLSCDLFRDAVNREIFLSLDGNLRTMWLKKQLTKIR